MPRPPMSPIWRRSSHTSSTMLKTETIEVESVMPATPSGPSRTQSSRAFRPRFTRPTYSGSHGFCMLWKLRLNMPRTKITLKAFNNIKGH